METKKSILKDDCILETSKTDIQSSGLQNADIAQVQYQNFQDIAELQQQLLETDETNVEELFQEILGSHLIKSKWTFRSILVSLYISFLSRPRKEKIYIDLFIKIAKLPENHFKSIDYLLNFSNCFFILNLYNAGLVTIDTIFEHAKRNSSYIEYFYPELFVAYPYIFKVQKDLKTVDLKTLIKEINLIQIESYSTHNNSNQAQGQQIEDRTSVFKTFIQYRSQGHHPCILMRAIYNDDLQEMQNILSQNNIPPFIQIKPSIFENCRIMNSLSYHPTLIEYAAFFGSINCFKFLFQKLQPNLPVTLVDFAVAGGNYDIIHLCESVLAYVFSQDCLDRSIQFFNNSISEYLLDNFPIVKNTQSATRSAIFYNLSSLINHQDVLTEDPNGLDKLGYSVLSTACLNGDFDVVMYLLSSFKKINLNRQNSDGSTPFICAIKNGHIEIVQYLASLPSFNIKYQNPAGFTALHFAALKGYLNIVEFLCSLPNIDINSESKIGATALSLAAYYGHFDVIKFLTSFSDIKLHCALTNAPNDIVYYSVLSGRLDIFAYIIVLVEKEKVETAEFIHNKAVVEYSQYTLPSDILNNTIEPKLENMQDDINEEEEEDQNDQEEHTLQKKIDEYKLIELICTNNSYKFQLWNYFKYYYHSLLVKAFKFAQDHNLDDIVQYLKAKNVNLP